MVAWQGKECQIAKCFISLDFVKMKHLKRFKRRTVDRKRLPGNALKGGNFWPASEFRPIWPSFCEITAIWRFTFLQNETKMKGAFGGSGFQRTMCLIFLKSGETLDGKVIRFLKLERI
jgi:hypothetical protein